MYLAYNLMKLKMVAQLQMWAMHKTGAGCRSELEPLFPMRMLIAWNWSFPIGDTATAWKRSPGTLSVASVARRSVQK